MFPLKDSNQARSFPFVNYFILVLNLVFFLFELSLPEEALNSFVETNGFESYRFVNQFGLDQLMTIFTSMFMHGGWLHILSNMWALHIFGDNVEDRMGHSSYLVFYVVCGVIAALSQIIMLPDSSTPTIGASGALAGVLGAYLILFPKARIITFIPIIIIPWFIEVPAVLFLGIWFFTQFFVGLGSLISGALAGGETGGVAWWAHVGGFIGGMILVKFFEKRKEYQHFYPDEYYPW